ncbi:MAG: hypothetical protein JRE20_13940 [Deltaproteobacteria bacterium]|nr:hypothetical protein [Deltaproteobacteria bacterium]
MNKKPLKRISLFIFILISSLTMHAQSEGIRDIVPGALPSTPPPPLITTTTTIPITVILTIGNGSGLPGSYENSIQVSLKRFGPSRVV